jgi:hypothetical protein
MSAMNIVGLSEGTSPEDSSVSSTKWAVGVRIPIFGHAGHTTFMTSSTEYVDVPSTYSAVAASIRGTYRVEVVFAANHDRQMALRMFDPANPDHRPNWEFIFQAGHAPIDWWTFDTRNFSSSIDPWQRQNTLQIRSLDGSLVNLASVHLVMLSSTP